jgi:hypothetical protein
MITLNVELEEETKEYFIPENWQEIKVSQFGAIIEAQDTDNLSGIEKAIKVMKAVTDIEEDIIYQLAIDDFNKIVDVLSFTNTPIEPENKESIIVDGEEYFLKKDFDKLLLGEIISIELIMEKTQGNIFKSIEELLCIFLRKKKENGKLEPFKSDMMLRANKFKEISITDIYQLMLFFLNSADTSKNNTKDSLEEIKETLNEKVDLNQ